MGKNKAYAPTLPRIRYMSCVDLTRRSRCNSSSRCCYRARERALYRVIVGGFLSFFVCSSEKGQGALKRKRVLLGQIIDSYVRGQRDS